MNSNYINMYQASRNVRVSRKTLSVNIEENVQKLMTLIGNEITELSNNGQNVLNTTMNKIISSNPEQEIELYLNYETCDAIRELLEENEFNCNVELLKNDILICVLWGDSVSKIYCTSQDDLSDIVDLANKSVSSDVTILLSEDIIASRPMVLNKNISIVPYSSDANIKITYTDTEHDDPMFLVNGFLVILDVGIDTVTNNTLCNSVIKTNGEKETTVELTNSNIQFKDTTGNKSVIDANKCVVDLEQGTSIIVKEDQTTTKIIDLKNVSGLNIMYGNVTLQSSNGIVIGDDNSCGIIVDSNDSSSSKINGKLNIDKMSVRSPLILQNTGIDMEIASSFAYDGINVEYQQPDTYIYSKFINRSGGK